ncbi:hypothetical protein EWM64_g8865 [Hericium alpestre]|uniref:Uncharacterized protein n=1 Tax=Hericium alpestre TaxID=135208 RepID=A0A4Y9ZM37_9AGAM|nr:hypothetical protein EWM64_g8865 [Hericium alpestre]
MYGITVLHALGDPQFIAYVGANHPLPALAAENAKVIERWRAEREEAKRVDVLDESAALPEKDWNMQVEDAVVGLWFAASHADRLVMMK